MYRKYLAKQLLSVSSNYLAVSDILVGIVLMGENNTKKHNWQ